METLLTTFDSNTSVVESQTKQRKVPPIIRDLEAIFKELPDDELLKSLRGPRHRGPQGYSPKILWRCFIVYYYSGLHSVSDLIRMLEDNPHICNACGIEWPSGIPSQPTFSRFFTRLSRGQFRDHVVRVFYRLTQKSYEKLPNFGKSVAVDATDLKAWSNGAHGKPTDKDAGWVIKTDTAGRGKFTWGYKLSLLVDTTYELPLAMKATSGNVHDIKVAPALLSQARRINSKFHPEYIIADMGYSSKEFRYLIHRQYRSKPIVKAGPHHKKAQKEFPETPDWQLIYNRRTSVERVFSRLKGHRKLNYIRVRGLRKVLVHCLMSLIVFQAQVLATGNGSLVRKVAYPCLLR